LILSCQTSFGAVENQNKSNKPDEKHLIDQYNVVWTTQRRNAGESMPVSGGDIGLNVWVEKSELMVYMGRVGYRDENGTLSHQTGKLKTGLIFVILKFRCQVLHCYVFLILVLLPKIMLLRIRLSG